MKRFILDGFLIILLVALGSSISQNANLKPIDIQQKLNDFEQQVDHRAIVGQHTQGMPLSQTKENPAGQLGSSVSEFVIEIVGSTLNLVSTLFQDFTE